MSNDIQLYDRMENPLDAIDRIGEFFAKSAIFGCDRVEQGKVLAMICLSERKSPVEITRNYDIIDGKLRKKALSALGEFRLRGGKHRWLKTGDDGQEAEIELTFDGQTIRSKFNIADANRQGLIRPRSNWERSPSNMLRSRAISNGIAMIAPEIYAGEDPGEEAVMPAATLNLGPAPTPTQAAAPQAAPIPVNVEVMTDATPAPAPTASESQAPTPTPTPTPTPAPFQSGPQYSSPGNKRLSADLQKEVEDAIGEHAIKAVTWMRKEGWLEKGQDIGALTEARARRILKQRESFIARVKEAA